MGANVFVVSVGRFPVAAIHLPIADSLRPPPYASAVSKDVMPRDHAVSMIAKASSSDSPVPKSSGAEPIPPKFPQPRTTRLSRMPVAPSSRSSTARFYGRSGTIRFVFACPPVPPAPPPRADRPRYALDVRIANDLKTVDGSVTVRFTPNRPTTRLVFRLWPNGPLQRREGSKLEVGDASADGKKLPAARPDPTTLVLRTTVRAGATITVHLPWKLTVPFGARDRISRFPSGVPLGSFYPVLAWDPRRGGVTDPPARILSESSTTPTADYDVHVEAPRGMQAVVSGTEVGPGRWHAHAVRDVGVAAA